ncbi:MAG: shikimate kinase [Spirochaetales bacterium]
MIDQKIALIGFMGCGKTSIGKVLASRLSAPFVDLDEEIERIKGRTVKQIFESEGEAVFRTIETETLSRLAQRKGDLILSCGGGIVLSAANSELLSREYLAVWIHVPAEELIKRLSRERDGRPLLNDVNFEEKVKKLLEIRLPLYKKASAVTYRWKDGESTTDSATAIMNALAQAR